MRAHHVARRSGAHRDRLGPEVAAARRLRRPGSHGRRPAAAPRLRAGGARRTPGTSPTTPATTITTCPRETSAPRIRERGDGARIGAAALRCSSALTAVAMCLPGGCVAACPIVSGIWTTHAVCTFRTHRSTRTRASADLRWAATTRCEEQDVSDSDRATLRGDGAGSRGPRRDERRRLPAGAHHRAWPPSCCRCTSSTCAGWCGKAGSPATASPVGGRCASSATSSCEWLAALPGDDQSTSTGRTQQTDPIGT